MLDVYTGEYEPEPADVEWEQDPNRRDAVRQGVYERQRETQGNSKVEATVVLNNRSLD